MAVKTVRDDLGVEVPAPAIRAGAIPDPDHPASRAMLARIGDRMFGESRGWGRLVGYSALLPIAILGTCVGTSIVGSLTRSPWLAIVTAVVLLLGASFVLIRILSPDLSQPLAGGLRHAGRCGSCCHPLAGAPTEGGVTRCSECGAAWLSATIAEVHVPDADAFGARRLSKALSMLRTPRLRFRDTRRRFVSPRWPKARWLRGTSFAGAGRAIRWTVIGVVTLQIAIVFGAAVGVIVVEAQVTGLALILALVLGSALFGTFGVPLLLIAMLRRRGLCPACINPLNADRWCAACGAAWGAVVPPPPPDVPPPTVTPPRHPPQPPVTSAGG